MLAKSRIATPKERYRADVSGDIEDVDGVLKITRINVHYTLKLAPDQRDAAKKAFDVYLPHCPSATSVQAAIEINHTLELQDK